MKKNLYTILISVLFLLGSHSTFGTTHIIVSMPPHSFSPDSVSAVVGDTVMFNLASVHSAIEVSASTWAVNGNTSNGGFTLPLGGGMVVLTQVKTYYFVCGVHFSFGMKGRIFVSSATGINTPPPPADGLEIYPNPARYWITLRASLQPGKENTVKIFNLLGKCLYERENVPATGYLNINGIPSGIYFVEVRSEGLVREKRLVIE